MSPAEKALRERVRRRAAAVSPELARRTLAAYDMIRQSPTEAELARAIGDGTVEALIGELLGDDTLDPAFARLRAHLDRVTADAAELYAGDLPSRFRGPAFNVLNPKTVTAVHTMSGWVIERMKAEIRDTVRERVAEGIVAGKNPRAIARGLRHTIGMAPNQARAVENFRRMLEAGDRRALTRALAKNMLRNAAGKELVRAGHAGGKGLSKTLLDLLDKKLGREPLSAEVIDKAVNAYAKRQLAWNVETNTRTMALNAQRLGQRLSWEDAIERGVVDRTRLQRTWVTVGDSRVRPEHEAMNGESVRFDENYSNGDTYPGESDYNCRCIERYSMAREAR